MVYDIKFDQHLDSLFKFLNVDNQFEYKENFEYIFSTFI